jgi:hypothetical protein
MGGWETDDEPTPAAAAATDSPSASIPASGRPSPSRPMMLLAQAAREDLAASIARLAAIQLGAVAKRRPGAVWSESNPVHSAASANWAQTASSRDSSDPARILTIAAAASTAGAEAPAAVAIAAPRESHDFAHQLAAITVGRLPRPVYCCLLEPEGKDCGVEAFTEAARSSLLNSQCCGLSDATFRKKHLQGRPGVSCAGVDRRKSGIGSHSGTKPSALPCSRLVHRIWLLRVVAAVCAHLLYWSSDGNIRRIGARLDF